VIIVKNFPAIDFTRITSFLVASLLVLISFGCKQKSSPVESGTSTQVLHAGNGLEPQDLDPHIITGISEIRILSALFEGLVGQDPKDLSPVPGAASGWDVSENGRTYTFHLRENLKWSNGKQLSSKDFDYSFQRMLNPNLGASNSYLLFVLKNAKAYFEGQTEWENVGVKSPDPNTLVLELENPTPYLLRLLAHPAWFPIPKSVLSEFGEPLGRATGWTRAGKLVSNGPFELTDWRINENVHMTRNEQYWDKATTRLKEIYFYPTESKESEERAFRRGQLHLTEAMPASKVGYYRDQKNPSLQIDPYLGTFYLQLNTRKQPLTDRRVRRALSLVLDRRLIVEKITQGKQQPAWHFTPPGIAGYDPKITGEKNSAEAKRLLAEAGFENGEGFPVLTYLYNTSENNKAIAEALQQMWQSSLGIHIELTNQEWKVFTQTRETGDFDLLRSSWIADYEDPSTFLDVWTSQSGNNFTGWTSKEYDQLIQATQSKAVESERFALFESAEKLLINEQPIIPIYFYTSVYLKHNSVKGYYPTLLNYHPWKFVYLDSNPE
jgi:oligopeptide transport system substrate-binding protein